MSISQIKRRFEQFESYLGRDVQGLGKLKALKDAVNELRTSLAQSEAKAAEQAAMAGKLAQRSRELSREKEEADVEIHRLQQVVANLKRDLRAAQAQPETSDQESEGGDSEAHIKGVVKRLRRSVRTCPKASRVSGEFDDLGNKARVWKRESLADGWSHEAIWNLGASVAVLLFVFGTVVLETSRTRKNQVKGTDLDDQTGLIPVVKWLKDNVDWTELEVLPRELDELSMGPVYRNGPGSSSCLTSSYG